jgi:hypothetical protein
MKEVAKVSAIIIEQSILDANSKANKPIHNKG